MPPKNDSKTGTKFSITDEDALNFHQLDGKPGKLEIVPTKPMATQRDLSLAYSPGVAVPVEAIAADPSKAYDYTNKGNLVAVITNGTAILGLGALGALASKPVMEGKAVLFKRFADVDSIDIEIDTVDPDEFINAVRYMGPSFGGINLEDIKAPECFIIEQKLREVMNIPVFHDDQHGTAIISAAGIINALHLTGRKIEDSSIVINGAGAAGIACLELIKALGIKNENAYLCDTKGVIYQGRKEGMNQWKSAHATKTDKRTLDDAMNGVDIVLGLSVQGAFSENMIRSMASNPIIFAMANPDPEITPAEVHAIRDDAIVATGRSDYDNQVNNVLGFPYIFRGALDVQACTINDEMKIAAARALAALAREDVPDEVTAAYGGERPRFGRNYIIPVPFDPRLMSEVSAAVAQAAMDSGVASKPISDMEAYKVKLSGRLNPALASLSSVYNQVRNAPSKRVVFAEGEMEQVVRAANSFLQEGLGQPILVGRKKEVLKAFELAGVDYNPEIEIAEVETDEPHPVYLDFLYRRLQREGFLLRDVQRMIRLDRNVFASCMLANGDADGMVTGVTRSWAIAHRNIRYALDVKEGREEIAMSMVVCGNRTVLIADTSIHEAPTSEEVANIAQEAARMARSLGYVPRVALLAHATFGYPKGRRSQRMHEAVKILDGRDVDFEYDGEMNATMALDMAEREKYYPFCRLSGEANILVMPDWNTASTVTKTLEHLGGCSVTGPLLSGLEHSVQIASLGATDTDLVTLAVIAAFEKSE